MDTKVNRSKLLQARASLTYLLIGLCVSTALIGCGRDGGRSSATPPPPVNPVVTLPPVPPPKPLFLSQTLVAEPGTDTYTLLGRGTAGAWSRDGQRITLSRNENNYLLDLASGELSRLPDGINSFLSPAVLSPDGTRLALIIDEGSALYDVDASPGTEPTTLVRHHAFIDSADFSSSRVDSPAWSPDDERIALAVSWEAGGNVYAQRVYQVTADGTDGVPLTGSDEHSAYESQPDWSPDGSRIVFVRNGSEIVTAPASGESAPNIPVKRAAAMNEVNRPVWLQDGIRIAFYGNPGFEEWDLWIVSAEGGPAERMDLPGVNPQWSSDGRIAFSTGEFCADQWLIHVWVVQDSLKSGWVTEDGLEGEIFAEPQTVSSITARVGGRLEWLNQSQVPPQTAHIVSTSHPTDGAAFDSGLLEYLDSFTFVPDVEGSWEFVDLVSGVTGTLIVDSTVSRAGLKCD